MCINTRQQTATQLGIHLQKLKEHIIRDGSSSRGVLKQDMKHYWTFRAEIVIIDRITMKGKQAIIQACLQKLHSNHICIEKVNYC